MADRYLLESGSPDGYLLEDGTGVLLLDNSVAWEWDNSSHFFTLSPTGLTATSTGTGDQLVRAGVTLASGSFTVTPTFTGFASVGFSDLTQATNDWIGDSTNSIGYNSNGNIYDNGGALLVAGASYVSGDVIKAEIQGDGKFYFYKNGTLQNAGGTTGPAGLTSPYPAASTSAAGNVLVADFTGWAVSGSPALTGQSVTSARGSVLAALALALSGGALTGSQGSVAPQVSQALTSQSTTAARGSVSPNVTIALTGQSLSAAQGTVVGGQPIVGQLTTAAQGSVTQSVSVALTGQSLTAVRGTLTPGTTEALSGQSLSSAQGTLTPGIAEALTGQALVAARGSVTAAPSIALSGQSTVAAGGTVAPTFALALSGGSLVVTGGTVTASVSSTGTVALTGQSLGTAIGSLVATISPALSGQDISLTGGSLVSAYSLALTGQGLTGSQGTIAGGEVLPTQPFVPPTISFGFRRKLPTQATWGPGSSSGAAWTEENETQNNWAAGGNSSGANWEKS